MRTAVLHHMRCRRLYLLAERECCKDGRVFCPLAETNRQKDEK
jgi:hypothetical protein